jgi:hypothetical protein
MGKTRQQGLFLGHGHVLALASTVRPGLEGLDAPVIVSHMRAVYCAQRNAHGRRNRRLRHPALAQQHHLDALSLRRRKLTSQRRPEPPDLGSTAFDHLLLPNQMVTANHTSNPENNSPFHRILWQQISRFMLFWSRYDMLYLYVPDVDAVYRKALKAGGTSLMEPTDQFYGDRSGGVVDPAGNRWHIGTHVEDVAPGELKKRAAAAIKQQGTAVQR